MGYDPKTGGFRSLGEFMVTVRKQIDRDIQGDSRLQELMVKTMTEGTDSAGGFTVPEKWAGEIYHAALEDSIVRQRAIIRKMASDTENIGILVDSDRSSNIFGGITFTWIEETQDKAALAADPKIGDLKLTAHEGVAVTMVQNQLEDDVDNFGDFIKLAFGRAVRFYEDYYYLHGSGSGQPLGIVQSGYTISVGRTQASSVKHDDFTKMARRLLPGSWNSAVWLLNPDTLNQVFTLDTAESNVTSVIDVNQRKILGFPFIMTEKAEALGTAGDVILADFKNGYVIGDRSMEIAGSRHFNYSSGTYGFLKNQTCWRIVLRVDGQPVLSQPITPIKGVNTLSSFVMLGDYSS